MLHTTRKFAEYVPVFGALSETSLQTLSAAPPRCSDLLGVSRSRAGLAHGGGSSTGASSSSSVNESDCALVCAASLCNDGPLALRAPLGVLWGRPARRLEYPALGSL